MVDGDLDLTDEFGYLDPQFPADSKLMEPLRRWSTRSAEGTLQPPWPVGAGLIMTPFYAVGYGVERLAAAWSGRPPDSYGLIAQYGFALGSVALGLFGFWCLVLMCREIVDQRVAYLASLGAVFCGPLVFYVFVNPTMAHASSFGLVALLTLIWLRSWKYGADNRTLTALGLLLGVAATIRYQNALFAILPTALVLREFRRSGFAVAAQLAAVGALAGAVPVLLLLHDQFTIRAVHGHAAVTSAQYPLDPTSPYFFDVLFSCRHGAFHWAPLLGIGALGLVGAALRKNGWAIVPLLTLAAQVYLIGGLGLSTAASLAHPQPPGWLHHWGDAPSFGMRYLTECAPLLALGLAGAMQVTVKQIGLRVWIAGVLLFAVWNGLLIVAYGLETITRSGCLPYADMLTGTVAAVRALFSAL